MNASEKDSGDVWKIPIIFDDPSALMVKHETRNGKERGKSLLVGVALHMRFVVIRTVIVACTARAPPRARFVAALSRPTV